MASSRLRFSSGSADWAGLNLDILDLILEKIRFIPDLVVFGSVCKLWAEAACNNKRYLRSQIPWMILPDYENNQLLCGLRAEESEEYTLTKNLPIPYKFKENGCFTLNYGWILTLSPEGDMNLVHPLSRSRIELPPLDPGVYISRAALSADPSQTSNFALTIIEGGHTSTCLCCTEHGGCSMCLSYTSLGDGSWTLTFENELPGDEEGRCSDVTYYQDRIYAVTYEGKVWGRSVSNPQDEHVLVADLSIPLESSYRTYIVGFEGDLLVVVRTYARGMDESSEKWLGHFQVHRVDLINGGHKPITSLGDRAIFVGHNTTTTIFEVLGGLIKPNHIYYTAYGNAFFSHRLEDGLRTSLKVPMSLGTEEKTVPFWYSPSL